MKNILKALGLPVNPKKGLEIYAQMAITIFLFLVAKLLIGQLISIPYEYLHLGYWLSWFSWLGFFFLKNREKYLKRYHIKEVYRIAYYHDILPGVAFGVSQMLQPFFQGAVHDSLYLTSVNVSLFLLVTTGGLSLMAAGFAIIGLSGASFLNEYVQVNKQSVLSEMGIYAYIRHPLFLGGIMASVGSTLIFSNTIILLGLINFSILPLYCYLEDRRQLAIWGNVYLSYKKQTRSVIPYLKKNELSMPRVQEEVHRIWQGLIHKHNWL